MKRKWNASEIKEYKKGIKRRKIDLERTEESQKPHRDVLHSNLDSSLGSDNDEFEKFRNAKNSEAQKGDCRCLMLEMPKDMLKLIFSRFHIGFLLRKVSLVCKFLHNFIQNEASFWHSLSISKSSGINDAKLDNLISSHPTLQQVSLRELPITDISSLQTLDLQDLELSGCNLLTMKKIASTLAMPGKFPNLKNICLQLAALSFPNKFSTLAKIIENHKGLEVLTVPNSCFNAHCADTLATNCPNLKELNVNNCPITWQMFDRYFQNMPYLTTFSANFLNSTSKLKNDVVMFKLRELSLSGSDVDDQTLGHIISSCENLVSLDISKTPIKGAVFLHSNLFSNLNFLSLAWCSKLDLHNLMNLQMRELKHLDASGTSITENQINTILKNVDNLEKLLLDSCRNVPREKKKNLFG